MELNRYVVTLRAVYEADDDEVARLIADKIRENGAEDLDEDDTLDVTQITRFSSGIAPEEAIIRLRQARNLLLRTRLEGSYDLAKQLDQFIHAMVMGEAMSIANSMYDHGKFFEIAEAILIRKESPHD